ncbi:hypothetical protein [Ferruginibacter sp. SUN106]|uniref:hypothetical protein n=1 Tax=Ferruginibacter sp. SUN106 TaxID=2978348 RepID=UPI003D36FA01
MKHFILPVAFTVICCTAFAQTKKADSTKKIIPVKTSQPQLAQEKIWPINNMPAKNADAVIINQHLTVKTRLKL